MLAPWFSHTFSIGGSTGAVWLEGAPGVAVAPVVADAGFWSETAAAAANSETVRAFPELVARMQLLGSPVLDRCAARKGCRGAIAG